MKERERDINKKFKDLQKKSTKWIYVFNIKLVYVTSTLKKFP